MLLIAIAICCYCKFKPPTEDGLDMYMTGNSSGRKKQVAIPVSRHSQSYDGQRDGGYTTQPHTQMTNYVYTESRERTLPSTNMSEDEELNTSDEDVLTGQYGGRIVASSKQHVVSSNQDISTTNTQRRHYMDSITASPQQQPVQHNIVTPIDMHKYEDEEEDEDEDEDEYYEESEEEYEEESENDYANHHGRKNRQQRYVINRAQNRVKVQD